MNRLQKQAVVDSLRDVMGSYAAVIVTKNHGISVDAANDLRRKVKKSDGHYYVAKNTLIKIAVGDTCYDSLRHLFVGPTALAYSNNPVDIAKVLSDFCSKNDKLQILGGAMGEVFLTPKQVGELAAMPSLDESRAKIVGLLNASTAKLIGVLNAPARNIVGVLSAYSKE